MNFKHPLLGVLNKFKTSNADLDNKIILGVSNKFKTSTTDLYSNISMVGSSGLEPPTSRLSGVRSNRLSYEPSRKLDCGDFLSPLFGSFFVKDLVEMSGIEPLTPCLQSRCSPG